MERALKPLIKPAVKYRGWAYELKYFIHYLLLVCKAESDQSQLGHMGKGVWYWKTWWTITKSCSKTH